MSKSVTIVKNKKKAQCQARRCRSAGDLYAFGEYEFCSVHLERAQQHGIANGVIKTPTTTAMATAGALPASIPEKSRLAIKQMLEPGLGQLDSARAWLLRIDLSTRQGYDDASKVLAVLHNIEKQLDAWMHSYTSPLRKLVAEYEQLFRTARKLTKEVKGEYKRRMSEARMLAEQAQRDALQALEAGGDFDALVTTAANLDGAQKVTKERRRLDWRFRDGKGLKDLPEEWLAVNEPAIRTAIAAYGKDLPTPLAGVLEVYERIEVSA